MKTCSKCKEDLPLDMFSKNNSKRDGLQSMCKSCKKAWYDNYYRTSPKEKSRLAENRKAKQAEFRALIREKKSVPCADCEVEYPYYVMDFDHLDDKQFNVSQAINKYPLEKVEAEIAKCEVVCSNCHRERTHTRR